MKTKDQLKEWVNGKPIHNDERDVCCPDFSCCGKPLATIDIRKRFFKAYTENDQDTMNEMLMMFLGNALKNENVYIAGGGQGAVN